MAAALAASSAEAALLLLVLLVRLAAVALRCGEGLSLALYDESCPEAEAAVTAAVRQAMANDRTVAAGLLRMHFHDCFVRVRNFFVPSISILALHLLLLRSAASCLLDLNPAAAGRAATAPFCWTRRAP